MSTSEVPTIHTRKMCEFETKAALRGANTRRTALSSLMRTSSNDDRPTVSIQNGRRMRLRTSSDSAWSSSEKNGFGPGGGNSLAGRKSATRPSDSCAMRRNCP